MIEEIRKINKRVEWVMSGNFYYGTAVEEVDYLTENGISTHVLVEWDYPICFGNIKKYKEYFHSKRLLELNYIKTA